MDKNTSHFDEIWDESGFLIGFVGKLARPKHDSSPDSSGDEDGKLMYVSENIDPPVDLKDSGVS